jgi:hypothetical protein
VKAPLKLAAKYFKLSRKTIDFGMCEAGGARKANVSVTSLCEKTVGVGLRSIERSWRLNERVFDAPSAVRAGGVHRRVPSDDGDGLPGVLLGRVRAAETEAAGLGARHHRAEGIPRRRRLAEPRVPRLRGRKGQARAAASEQQVRRGRRLRRWLRLFQSSRTATYSSPSTSRRRPRAALPGVSGSDRTRRAPLPWRYAAGRIGTMCKMCEFAFCLLSIPPAPRRPRIRCEQSLFRAAGHTRSPQSTHTSSRRRLKKSLHRHQL